MGNRNPAQKKTSAPLEEDARRRSHFEMLTVGKPRNPCGPQACRAERGSGIGCFAFPFQNIFTLPIGPQIRVTKSYPRKTPNRRLADFTPMDPSILKKQGCVASPYSTASTSTRADNCSPMRSTSHGGEFESSPDPRGDLYLSDSLVKALRSTAASRTTHNRPESGQELHALDMT